MTLSLLNCAQNLNCDLSSHISRFRNLFLMTIDTNLDLFPTISSILDNAKRTTVRLPTKKLSQSLVKLIN